VSTNLTEQISRRFPGDPGGSSRKIQDIIALLRHATQCTESTSLPKIEQKHDMYNIGPWQLDKKSDHQFF